VWVKQKEYLINLLGWGKYSSPFFGVDPLRSKRIAKIAPGGKEKGGYSI
jgi:hypothetical protein